MKTKTVTIEYWDGSKQKITVPKNVQYIEQTPNSGELYAHATKPVRMIDGDLFRGGEWIAKSPPDNRPIVDGITRSILLKIEEV